MTKSVPKFSSVKVVKLTCPVHDTRNGSIFRRAGVKCLDQTTKRREMSFPFSQYLFLFFLFHYISLFRSRFTISLSHSLYLSLSLPLSLCLLCSLLYFFISISTLIPSFTRVLTFSPSLFPFLYLRSCRFRYKNLGDFIMMA